MNKEQVKLLNESGFEVLEEISFIREKDNSHPFISLVYNNWTHEFDLSVLGTIVKSDSIEKYQNEITKKLELVKKLNKLA